MFVADEQTDVRVDVERWQQLALGVLAEQGVRGLAELTVLFVDRSTIAELNEEHMGASGPTDVLSFPIDAADAEIVLDGQPPSRGPDRPVVDLDDIPLLLGDVVICPAIAVEQADAHAGTVDDELALLLVHGMLHVLGHDHAEPEEKMTMRAAERHLLETLHWHGAAPEGFRHDHIDDGGA